MINIDIIYHSGFGHTEVQALHVEKGVQSVDGVNSRLIKAEEAVNQPEILNKADGIIFGSPTYLGAVSAPFKEFMDATSGIWHAQSWKDKIAAGFTNSMSLGGDKLTTLVSLSVFAAQHGMIWVGQAEMNTSPHGQSGHPDAINRTGTMMGAVAQSDDGPATETPSRGDLTTAELFGRRIAETTWRFY